VDRQLLAGRRGWGEILESAAKVMIAGGGSSGRQAVN
jgi:hypothetical protein